MKYIIVDKNFFDSNHGFTFGSNVLQVLLVKNGSNKGQYVCPENSKTEFPDLFKDQKIQFIELSDHEFEDLYEDSGLMISGKYPVISKTENYVNKTVTLTYFDGKEVKSIVENKSQETATKTGYLSTDIEKKVQDDTKDKTIKPIK